MKNLGITTLAALAVIAASCSNEDDFLTNNPQNEENVVVLSATISDGQGGTRSLFDIDETGKKATFHWNTGDAITVFSPEPTWTNQQFDLTGGEGTKTGTFAATGTVEVGTLAYYPYNVGHENGTFVLPDTYGAIGTPYAEDTHAAYSATIAENTATFLPLAGVLQVKFESVPAGVDKFELTADQDIYGKFDVSDGEISTTDTPTDAGKTVTFTFTTLASAQPMTFYIPLPTGIYESFQTVLKADDDVVFTKTYTKSQEIQKGKLTAIGSLSSPDYTVATEGSVTTYTVYTAAGLQAVGKLINDNITIAAYNTANITLGADIELTGEGNWTAIGGSGTSQYKGTFNGNNKTITGLNISGTGRLQGLIASLGAGGVIKDVNLKNCYVKSTAELSGCVAGVNYGLIDNCHISGSVTVTGPSNNGGIAGGLYDGGIIRNCSVDAENENILIEVSTTSVGGIVGYIATGANTVIDCSVSNTGSAEFKIKSGEHSCGGIAGNTGANSSNTIIGCSVKNSGSGTIKVGATDYKNAGGIIGFNWNGTVSSCFVGNVNVIGADRVGGIAGKSSGTIMACYAYQCTKGDTPVELDDSSNVVGSNKHAPSSGTTNGTVSYCYYNANGDTSENVTLVSGEGDAVAPVGSAIEWTEAASTMNGEIDKITTLPEGVVKYYWDGSYDAPTLTTTKPTQTPPSEPVPADL